jgi:hypothetical protein
MVEYNRKTVNMNHLLQSHTIVNPFSLIKQVQYGGKGKISEESKSDVTKRLEAPTQNIYK